MKILLVNDSARPLGGAEILTRTLRDGLRQRGHEARVFAANADANGESFADYQAFGTRSRLQTVTRAVNPMAAAALRRALRQFEPDVVHVRMFLTQLSPSILPVLRDWPSVYHVTDYGAVCPTGQKMLADATPCDTRCGGVCLQNGCVSAGAWPLLMLQMSRVRRGLGAFDRIVANSHATRRMLELYGIEPVDVVWNGAAVRDPRPPLSDPPTVGLAARLSRAKGVDVALHAFAQVSDAVPEARLLIAGDGPQRTKLQALAARLSLSDRVDWLGHVDRQTLERQFEKCWVQLVPSQWREPFGLVAVEAMMRGTAVIASDSGGLSEIVEDGKTGWLVVPGDVSELASRIGMALSDRPLAERMGRCGRERAVAHFTSERMIDEFCRRYRELLNEPTSIQRYRGQSPVRMQEQSVAMKQRTPARGQRSESAQVVRGGADEPTARPEPALSVILPACDRLEVQRDTIEHLRRQTIADRLEVIIVCPSLEGAERFARRFDVFHSYQFVQCEPNRFSLGYQQAVGVFAARAPLVAFGEDHCAPAPDWAEQLVEAFNRSEHVGIGVAIHNANPETALSWGNLILGYLNWVAPVNAGSADHIPGSNASYRRDALLALGDDLGDKLERGGSAQNDLRALGHTFYVEPAAKVYHKNASRMASTFRLRFNVARYLAWRQTQRHNWGAIQRLYQVLLSPLHPAYRLAKIVKRLAARGYPLNARIIAGVGVALSFDTIGLIAGYLLGKGDADRAVYSFEFNRDQHMQPQERRALREAISTDDSTQPAMS